MGRPMKRLLLTLLVVGLIPAVSCLLRSETVPAAKSAIETPTHVESKNRTIAGIVQSRETMDSIFGKHELDKSELTRIYHTSKKAYNLSRISVGSMYSFELSKDTNEILSMQFGISDDSFLNVERSTEGFKAEKIDLEYEKKTGSFYIVINSNLASSMPGTHREYRKLTQSLADIFAWDIDFSNDINNGDTVKIIVEELWLGEAFKGYGKILAAEFVNRGKIHRAYRYDDDGYVDYFDEKGKSLRKALLRSPLKFKYVSSKFNRRRLHPVLKVKRPHLGVDYAASTGTPVSAAGSGKVLFAGRKGQMGKMVKIKHPGGYQTYYGHLSRIPRKIRRGVKVSQGDLIGYVGSTGMATGPHLDYRIKYNGKFVNPLKIQLPRGKSLSKEMVAEFREFITSFDARLASLTRPVMAFTEKKKKAAG